MSDESDAPGITLIGMTITPGSRIEVRLSDREVGDLLMGQTITFKVGVLIEIKAPSRVAAMGMKR